MTFARAVGVSPMLISHVIGGTRPVTAALALLFGRVLDQSPQYWLNLQADYDLKTAKTKVGPRLHSVIPSCLPNVAIDRSQSVQCGTSTLPELIGSILRLNNAGVLRRVGGAAGDGVRCRQRPGLIQLNLKLTNRI